MVSLVTVAPIVMSTATYYDAPALLYGQYARPHHPHPAETAGRNRLKVKELGIQMAFGNAKPAQSSMASQCDSQGIVSR